MDDGRRLYELLMAIFRSDDELRRFLALEKVLHDESRGPAQKGQKLSATAYNTARILLERGLVDDALFAALRRRAPERTLDIESVARYYLTDGNADTVATDRQESAVTRPARPARDDGPEHSRRAGFAAKLAAELAELVVPEPESIALDAEHWPWTAVAAVLGSFRPGLLRPMPGEKVSGSATQALVGLTFVSFTGKWVLEERIRIICLGRLRDRGQLRTATEANSGVVDGVRSFIDLLLTRRPPQLPTLTGPELRELDAAAGWLSAAGIAVPAEVSQRAIEAAVERRLLIDPLRLLVGSHFSGRGPELARLRSCVNGMGTEQVMVIHGPGGAGKSTLVGKVLLELEEASSSSPVSFAYVDFDRARHNPRDRAGLLRQIAQQLRLLYATSGNQESEFAALESLSAGTDMARAAELLDISVDLDIDALTTELALRLLAVHREYGFDGSPPLVLVLDTCEEVQMKGPGAVDNVSALIEGLLQALPDMRLIAAGRTVSAGFAAGHPRIDVTLGDLDPDGARALLLKLGVTDEDLRTLIFDHFGGNPLTLTLAAEALARTGSASSAFSDVISVTKDLAAVRGEQVQGMLYARILGHIQDREVAAVAHPGLAMRLVTVPVLREVLAGPCGFDPDIAEDLFDRLRAEVSMFVLEDEHTLRHRQDVRRLMLRSMSDDPERAAVVAEIHRLAIDFYAAKTGLPARAEELYHRLLAGEDPRLLNISWKPELAGLLNDALDDPLPDRARRWLTRRLRFESTADERREWAQSDWEAQATSLVQSWLSVGEPLKALDVLAERSEREPGSRLFSLEVEARSRVGDIGGAASALRRGMLSAIDSDNREAQLALSEQAVPLAARQQDWAGVENAARSCLAWTDISGDRPRGLRVLTEAISLLTETDPTRAAALGTELTQRFASVSRDDMRADPEMTRRAIHASTDSSVLVRAALEVGDRAGEPDGVFFNDVFAMTRLLDQTDDSAGPALASLAQQVGLTGNDWTTADLASRAARTGRTGAAILVGLDHAMNDEAALSLVVSELAQPVGTVSEANWS